MFHFLKKRSAAPKNRNNAPLEKLKKTLASLLIDPVYLKKMGVKDLFAEDLKATKRLSPEDALACLDAIKLASKKIDAFRDRFMPMAEAVNEELHKDQMARIGTGKGMPSAHDFYTISNIISIFNEAAATVVIEKTVVENPEDLERLLNAFLIIFRSTANITMGFINLKATSMGITIQV